MVRFELRRGLRCELGRRVRWRRVVELSRCLFFVAVVAACEPSGAVDLPSPSLVSAAVETEAGVLQFRGGEAKGGGAEHILRSGKDPSWRWDIDGDGQRERLAVMEFRCVDSELCGNSWGAWLGAWSWRDGRYELVWRQDDIKGVEGFDVASGELRVLMQVRNCRNDLETVTFQLP